MRFFVLSIVGVILFGVLARPLVLNQVPIEFDLGHYHLPLRDFYQRCLQNGDDPAWCPQLFCGYDLHGEGQAGMDHPWHRLLYTSLPLVLAFNIEVFANYPLLCLGTYLFLRRHRLPKDAALAGALTVTFGGFTLPHYSHTNAIAIVAHIPWLLWATDILLTSECRRRCALAGMAIAMLTGSQILLGYPQYVYFSCLAEVLYAVLLLMQNWSWSRFVMWLVFKSLGIAIGGAQLLPSVQALQLSPRMGYDAAFRGMLSLPPEMFVQLVSPLQFNVGMQLHEYTVYGGVLATLGLAWLLSEWTLRQIPFRSSSILNRWAFWVTVIAVPLALGRHTPLFQVYLKVPIVGVFRCPCRYLVLSHLVAGVIVARLVEWLGSIQDRPLPWPRLERLLFLPIVAWLVAIIGPAFMIQGFFSQECLKFMWQGNAGMWSACIMTLATMLFLSAGRGHSWAVPLLLVIGFADLGYWGFRSIFGTRDTPVHTFVDLQTYRSSQLVPPSQPSGRIQISEIHGNGAMLLGWSLTSGYVGLSPPRTLDYQTDAALRLAATTWRFDGGRWNAVDGLPRLRWQTSIDGRSESTRVTSDRPGHAEVLTRTADAQVLIFAESYHPNWRATVDGQPAEVVRVDSDFQGCTVPAGEHRVVFHFDPVYRTYGRWLSLAGIGITLMTALWLARGRRSTMIPIQVRGDT